MSTSVTPPRGLPAPGRRGRGLRSSRLRFGLAYAAAALLAAVAGVGADTVTLTNGTVLSAHRVRVEGSRVILEQSEGRIILPSSAVEEITYTSPLEPANGEGEPGTRRPFDVVGYLTQRFQRQTAQPGGTAPGAAAALLSEGRLDAAKASAESSLRSDPLDLESRLVLAAVALRRGRNSSARDELATILAAEPDNPAALVLAGELAYRQQRLDEAIQHWEHALERQADPLLENRLEQARRELQLAGGHESLFNPLFEVQIDGEVGLDLARQVVDALQQDHQELASELGLDSSPRIPVILYPDADFLASTGLSRHVVLGLFDGKIRVPLGGVFRIDADVRSTLRHELIHALVHIKSEGRAPRWLQEGLAQHFEGSSAQLYESELADLLRSGAPVPLASYPYWLALVEFIQARYGAGTIDGILDQLAAGAEADEALSRELGTDFSGLERAWREDLLERVP